MLEKQPMTKSAGTSPENEQDTHKKAFHRSVSEYVTENETDENDFIFSRAVSVSSRRRNNSGGVTGQFFVSSVSLLSVFCGVIGQYLYLVSGFWQCVICQVTGSVTGQLYNSFTGHKRYCVTIHITDLPKPSLFCVLIHFQHPLIILSYFLRPFFYVSITLPYLVLMNDTCLTF